MGLPRHLREQFNATDGSPKDPAAAGLPTTSAAQPTGDATGSTPAAPAVEGQQSAAPSATPAAPAGGADTGAVATTATTQQTPPSSDEHLDDGGAVSGSTDANYRRMEGRYKAQIARLNEQLADLREQARGATVLTDLLAERSAELSALRTSVPASGTAPATAPGTTPATPEPAAFDLSPEEQEMYGEFAPVAEKLIAKATAPLLQRIEELNARTGEVDQRVGRTSETLFVRDVRSHVPDFDGITQDPQWQQYLQRTVPFTTLKLEDALRDAHNSRDLDRVVAIFDAFASERPPTAPPAGAAPAAAPTVAPAAAQAANGLAQFATPDRTATNPPGKPTPKFRNADYAAKAAEMRAGRMSKTEFMQFEEKFFEAKRAGLVS